MPVILRIHNIKFFFYSREGIRPHIHIELAEFNMAVWLDDLSIKQVCSDKQVQKDFLKLVKKNQAILLESWNEYFGVNDED